VRSTSAGDGTSTAATDSSNFLTDLLSSVDGMSAAADSTSFLTELASLF
jgi:hypothetical protein